MASQTPKPISPPQLPNRQMPRSIFLWHSTIIILLIYVDHVIITGSDPAFISPLIVTLL